MLKKICLIFLMLTPLIWGVHAAKTLTKDNFAEPILEPKLNKYYLPNTQISFNFTIQPKTDDDAKLIDGRIYEFNTSLESPEMKVRVEYGGSGPVRIYQDEDYIRADVKDWEDGLMKIYVRVSGKVPTVNKRIEKVTVLGIDIQDAEEDAVSDVVIYVVNKDKFSSYISYLEKRYSEIESRVAELEEKGISVVSIKLKLNSAKNKLEDGKTYFQNGDYGNANSSLSEAENFLNEAANLSRKTDLEFEIELTNKKLEDMFAKMTELELLIQSLKQKGESTINYEIKLDGYKKAYSDLKTRISQAEDFLSGGLYDDAQATLDEVRKSLDEKMNDIDSVVSEISSKLETTPTPEKTQTPPPEKTPESTPVSERISGFFSGISSWFSQNSRLVLMAAGALLVIGLGGYAGYRGLKSYMRRRKWDELK